MMRKLKRFLAGLTAAWMLTAQGLAIPATTVSADAPDSYHDDWLHVEGDKVVDMYGNEVWMTGVNWFGYNVGSQVFDGVWSVNMHDCLRLIADHGFNLLRVPMSTEIILQWKNHEPDPMIKINATTNPELVAEFDENGTPISYMYSFDVWNKAVEWCRELGIKIMIDIHCATTNAAGHNYALWYDSNFSTDDWLDALAWMADYYKDDDTIIAYDLKNEPHGKSDEGIFAKWDESSDENNWRYAAERGAMAVLQANPYALIMVEGIEVYPKFDEGATWSSPNIDYARYPYSYFYGAWWGANFRGVRDNPVDLGAYQSQLVYSPHDYGPLVYKQNWFHLSGDESEITSYDFDLKSLLDEYWYDTWAFLAEEHQTPLLMGEWGGFTDDEHDPSGANRHWLGILRDYMTDRHIHHTFWCFNENSADTGGLVSDNFGKWDDQKYDFIKSALWQDENGVFISLDHTVPIGANGQSLNDYYGSAGTSVPAETSFSAVTTTAPETTAAPQSTTVFVPAGEWVPGDANCNGKTEVDDVVMVCKFAAAAHDVTLTSAGQYNADCDSIKGLTVDDALLALKLIAQLIRPETLSPIA